MKSLRVLKKLSREAPAELYYAGEFARDILRRKKSGKVEIVVRGVPLAQVFQRVKRHFKDIHIARNKGSFSFMDDHSEVTIQLPKKASKHNHNYTLREDSRGRGFTINAMYLPVASRKGSNVIDFYRGRSCIKDRKIKIIGKADTAVKKNPILMMRALSLSSKLSYRIDNNLFYTIKANSELIKKVSIEEVRDEFVEIILGRKPSRYLKIMHDSHLMNHIIPELSICAGIAQNKKYHKYDVFNHCLVACDSIDPDLILRLAALLHDIGKAPTREEITKNGKRRVTFYNHEVVGSKIAKKILRRLKFDKDVIHSVSELVYGHMYNYEPIWTDAAVRRFIRKSHLTNIDIEKIHQLPLFLIRKADRAANGLGLSEVSGRQYDLENRIKRIYAEFNALSIVDLDVDGGTIMEAFNLKPGPTVGHVLNYLLSLVIKDQRINTKKRLIEEASKYLSEALE
jgi:poly(A) polymerase/tRNA nucleotidyltransferase (CCA-adding enzyme)